MYVIFTYGYLDSRTFIIGFAYGYQISREIGFAYNSSFCKKMIAYFRTFLLFFSLVVLPAHGGKRGPKVYPKKDENSDDNLMLQNWRKLLRDLMLTYTISIEEMRTLKKDKLREMSEKLA